MESVSPIISAHPHFRPANPVAPQIFWRKREECFVLTGEPKKGLALRAQASFLGDNLGNILRFAENDVKDGL